MNNNIKLFMAFLLCIMGSNGIAQDIIIIKSGEEIEAKINEVGVSEIKYKKWTNQDGPTRVVAKEDVFMIKYKNGEKEVFSKYASTHTTTTNSNMVKEKTKSRHEPTIKADLKSKSGATFITTNQNISAEEAEKIFGERYEYFYNNIRKWRKGIATLSSGCALNVAGGILLGVRINTYKQYLLYGKDYVYGDQWQSGNVIDNSLENDRLPEDPRKKKGIVLITAGAVCLTSSYILIPVGIVKIARGHKTANRIIDSLYEEETMDTPRLPLELKYGGMGNGVGIALKF